MPNWCFNTILIQGEPDEVEKLMTYIKDKDSSRPLSFRSIIAMPPQLEGKSAPERDEDTSADNILKYGAKDWYDWSNKFWGTKWDASEPETIYDKTSPMLPGHRTVKIRFQTAWAPPLPVYKVLADKFPNTNIFIAYEEPGVGFSGWQAYKGGELFREQEYDVSLEGLESYINPTEEIFAWLD